VTNEVTTATTFQDRVLNKLRDDIGALMTDEELQRLVREAAERLFFRPTEVKDRWGAVQKHEPSEFMATCKELLGPRVKEAATEYMKAHPEIIEEIVRKVVAEGFMGVFTAYMQEVSAGGIAALVQAFKQNGLLDPNKFYSGIR
jgi:hypothetical protein